MSILLIDPLIHKFSFVGAWGMTLLGQTAVGLTTAALVMLILGRKKWKIAKSTRQSRFRFWKLVDLYSATTIFVTNKMPIYSLYNWHNMASKIWNYYFLQPICVTYDYRRLSERISKSCGSYIPGYTSQNTHT